MIEAVSNDLVRGFIHHPSTESGIAVVLAHGAGSDCNSRVLVAVCTAIAESGVMALRIDLPFRVAGDKVPRNQERDRAGLRSAADFVRRGGRVILGGHSYGGRQASMLAAENPAVADRLLLMSYPLHPPRKPEQMRTAHFPVLRTPVLFVHGTRDPFGSPEEMRAAVPPHAELMLVEGAGHELKPVITNPKRIVERVLQTSAI
jgi:uncharacterized protein